MRIPHVVQRHFIGLLLSKFQENRARGETGRQAERQGERRRTWRRTNIDMAIVPIYKWPKSMGNIQACVHLLRVNIGNIEIAMDSVIWYSKWSATGFFNWIAPIFWLHVCFSYMRAYIFSYMWQQSGRNYTLCSSNKIIVTAVEQTYVSGAFFLQWRDWNLNAKRVFYLENN